MGIPAYMRTRWMQDISSVQALQKPTSPLPAVACIFIPKRPVDDFPSRKGMWACVSVYSAVTPQIEGAGKQHIPFLGYLEMADSVVLACVKHGIIVHRKIFAQVYIIGVRPQFCSVERLDNDTAFFYFLKYA
jgi:hypothetical protein